MSKKKKKKYGNPLKQAAYEAEKKEKNKSFKCEDISKWNEKSFPYDDYTVLSNTCGTLVISYATKDTLIDEMKKVKAKAMELFYRDMGLQFENIVSPCVDYTKENIVGLFKKAKNKGDDCITFRGAETGIEVTVGPSSIIKHYQSQVA